MTRVVKMSLFWPRSARWASRGVPRACRGCLECVTVIENGSPEHPSLITVAIINDEKCVTVIENGSPEHPSLTTVAIINDEKCLTVIENGQKKKRKPINDEKCVTVIENGPKKNN